MLALSCDDPAIQAQLAELAAAVAAEGGAAQPDAVCRSQGAQIWLETGPEGPQGPLLAVPDACLPRLASFHLAAAGDSFALAWAAETMPASQRRCLDALVALYNAAGRPGFWRRACPWLALRRDPELLATVLAAVDHEPPLPRYYSLATADEVGTLWPESFLHTRTFARPAAPGAPAGSGATDVLAPLIELLNHDLRARGLSFDDAGGPAGPCLQAPGDPVVPGSREVFLRYRLMDACHAYLHYGFRDGVAPLAFSIACELDLPGGLRLSVGNRLGPGFSQSLPPALEPYRAYMPRVLACDRDRLALQRVIVPSRAAPGADQAPLHTVLAGFLQPYADDAGPRRLERLVGSAEEQLLATNHAFYERVRHAVAVAENQPPAEVPAGRGDALATLSAIAGDQQAILADYAERAGQPLG